MSCTCYLLAQTWRTVITKSCFQKAVSSEFAKSPKMMEPSSLGANQYDLPLVPKQRGIDSFCWICHSSVNLKNDYSCHRCGRSFHYGCNGQSSKEAFPPGFTQFKFSSCTPSCPVCHHINQGACQYAPSELSELNKALSFVCEMLQNNINSSYFFDLVDVKKNHRYESLIVSPMALNLIENKANSACFNSPEEFLYDLKLIQHNSIVCYGKQTQQQNIIKSANALYKVALFEYCKISYCYQCYLKSIVNETQIYQSDQFLIACNRPHAIVWAQKPNQSLEAPYEPAKVINVSVGTKNSLIVDVCVFGSREIITDLKMNQCFVFTETFPSTGTKASVQKHVMLEYGQYVNSVNTTVNNNPLCPIIFEKNDKVTGIVKLTMDQIYLVKKVKSNVFRIGSIVNVSTENTISCQNETSAPPSSSKPNTSVESSAVKRKKSSKANDKNKLAKSSSTSENDALPFKIAFDPLQYQEFLPMAFFPNAVSVFLNTLNNNSSLAMPQSSESLSTSSSAPSPNAEIKSAPKVNIDSKCAPYNYSKILLRNEISMNKNKSVIIKEYQEKALKCIKVESELSECKEILQAVKGKFCRSCFQTLLSFLFCCRDVYYCCDQCQKNDWERHYSSCLRKKSQPRTTE